MRAAGGRSAPRAGPGAIMPAWFLDRGHCRILRKFLSFEFHRSYEASYRGNRPGANTAGPCDPPEHKTDDRPPVRWPRTGDRRCNGGALPAEWILGCGTGNRPALGRARLGPSGTGGVVHPALAGHAKAAAIAGPRRDVTEPTISISIDEPPRLAIGARAKRFARDPAPSAAAGRQVEGSRDETG